MSEIKEFSDWKGESTLFAFWFGINDITKTSWTIEETIIEGLNHLIKVLNECYEEGARNYLIFNIPPFDKSPEEFNVENVSLFITKFNNGIERKVKEFSLSNPEANVILYNSFDELECILMNHDKYNITDIKNEYVQNRKKNPYTFYWNNGCHPSEKVQQYLTEDLHNYLNSISVNKTPEINNSTVKASSHLIQTNGVNKFNIELSHSLFSIIIFYIIFIFF